MGMPTGLYILTADAETRVMKPQLYKSQLMHRQVTFDFSTSKNQVFLS